MSNKAESFDALMDNPEKYGFWNFNYFVKNREKIIGPSVKEQTLASVDQGSTQFNKCINKYIYELRGYRFDTLEQAERAALDMGINIEDYIVTLVQQGCGKADAVVKLMSKDEKAHRDKWG